MKEEDVNSEMVRKNLAKVIKDLHVNQGFFSDLVGINQSNLSKKLKGTQPITPTDFDKFAKANLSVEFLTTGEGDMYTGPVKTATRGVQQYGIPVYEEAFSCGFLTFGDSALHPIGFADMPGTRGATCWCMATGDSMMPMINNGDYICLKKIEAWSDFIVYGDVYAIDTYNDQRFVKRIERGRNATEMLLVSTNEGYEPQPIKKQMVRGLFRVVAVTKVL